MRLGGQSLQFANIDGTSVLNPLLSTDQQRIFDWLAVKLGLPIFANAYYGAVIQLQNRPPGFVTFTCHAGRDLMNILATTVAGVQAKQVQYASRVRVISDEWLIEWGATIAEAENAVETRSIPLSVCEKIGRLVADHREGAERNSNKDYLFFSQFLDYDDRDKIPPQAFGEWRAARKWFLDRAHVQRGEYSAEDEEITDHHFRKLEQMLLIAAKSEFERKSELDEILDETNG